MESDNCETAGPARVPETPSPGRTVAVAPGVLWIRMSLPFVLDHINLWAIEDGDGWTIVDTGIRHPDLIATWERLLAEDLGQRRVTRILVTHMHPDHAGLAGWLTERFGCRLWMTRTEYLTARSIATRTGAEPTQGTEEFGRRAGWTAEEVASNIARRANMAQLYGPFPDSFKRLRDGETLLIGGREWKVIAGGGHTPEHACLHCPSLDLLISGDKVLPKISSNISVDAAEPDDDPLSEWFETLAALRDRVPDSVLVLPSHKGCFRGLHARIDELIADQQDALLRLERVLTTPKRAVDLFETLFSRPIERSNISLLSLATGETIALLNHLLARGAIQRRQDDGVTIYQAR
ncbi:MBL fold metallo-hydrolase [Sphingopyxis sp. H038]|uniref:MBL fold metallo-hydrolase n=2 Tax=unclassified Sphingopyxis TaxID=2614943 RepID=UPI000731A864|nr:MULTISPECIES: MBL fold metallo-hydrolase [unclassified Sphingopyxis]KTE08116.1 MBL fold metallo-hydrolase [Sphingopyxis sp. H093]KTE13405.1 MBL fold metallo-hydrolase [Sphingopyxis sp. H053]KTE31245.1 MBL fold metallo-hydrolase [Sphingopyxis sp. H080]KTE47076.1 MBL fold metallo-hydrolase [Sphingopyxis sp. H005]KTE48308.1 MBL fold metallo-hydrolase [Sphingopyxis sp. H077]